MRGEEGGEGDEEGRMRWRGKVRKEGWGVMGNGKGDGRGRFSGREKARERGGEGKAEM